MRRYTHDDFYAPPPHPLQSAFSRFMAFLDARSSGEWIAFGAGLLIGVII